MPFPDNEHTNVEFVAALEEIPILYNYNLKEYSNRNKQEKAWRILAAKFNVTDAECKLRWKNIRGAFTRYLKNKNKTGSSGIKQYYLWEQLQFLLPYTKSRTQSGNLCWIPSLQSQLDETGDDIAEPDDFEQQTQPINQLNNVPSIGGTPKSLPVHTTTLPSSLTACRSLTVKVKKDDLNVKAFTTYLKKKRKEQKDVETNADLDFFKSLLPDIRNFPPAKKRLFKRKVLDIIDELSEEDAFSQRSAGTSSRSSMNSFTRDSFPPAATEPISSMRAEEFSPFSTPQHNMQAADDPLAGTFIYIKQEHE